MWFSTDFYQQIDRENNVKALDQKIQDAQQDLDKKQVIEDAKKLFEKILVAYQDKKRGRFEGPRMLG